MTFHGVPRVKDLPPINVRSRSPYAPCRVSRSPLPAERGRTFRRGNRAGDSQGAKLGFQRSKRFRDRVRLGGVRHLGIDLDALFLELGFIGGKEKLKRAIEENAKVDVIKAEQYTVGQWMDV